MPKLATGANSSRSRVAALNLPPRGFTLVEVLVVIVIAGILTGTVLMVIGQSGPAQANQRELVRLSASLEVLCDQALLDGAARGMRFHADGYDFWQYQPDTWLQLPSDSRPRPVRWPEGMRPQVEIENHVIHPARRQRMPQVVCTGIEPPTPFEIEIGRGEHRRSMSWPK